MISALADAAVLWSGLNATAQMPCSTGREFRFGLAVKVSGEEESGWASRTEAEWIWLFIACGPFHQGFRVRPSSELLLRRGPINTSKFAVLLVSLVYGAQATTDKLVF